MKIRTDFVTNSSSSSFLTVRIVNRELHDALLADERIATMGGEEFAFVNMIVEGSMRLDSDGSVTFTVLDIGSLPEDVSESLDYNIELIDDLLEDCVGSLDNDEISPEGVLSERQSSTESILIEAQMAYDEDDDEGLSVRFEYNKADGTCKCDRATTQFDQDKYWSLRERELAYVEDVELTENGKQ